MPSVVAFTIRGNEIDGATAVQLESDDIDDLTENKLDRKKLKGALGRIHAPPPSESKTSAEKETAEADEKPVSKPHSKHFASFLSHFKRECGTEARLVQQNLKPLLPEANNEVFLDSGKHHRPCRGTLCPSHLCPRVIR